MVLDIVLIFGKYLIISKSVHTTYHCWTKVFYHNNKEAALLEEIKTIITLVNVYVDLLVFTHIAGTS